VSYSSPGAARAKVTPSPVFLALIAIAAATGGLTWISTSYTTGTRFAALLFVLAGWIITLCLHEFAHAMGAWLAGDHEVEARGYLTLNPLKYAHPVLSIVLPVVFIALGGIGLPGGAVYLHPHRFRSNLARTLVSLAGPLTNVACAVVLLILVRSEGLHGHVYFWAAVSFLAELQIMAALLNLLPIPGLDGYAAVEPHLDAQTRQIADQIKPYGMILIFGLLQAASINRLFFDAIYNLFELSGVSRYAAAAGYQLIKFWSLR
jgi:Zn-dependent protease